MKALLICPDLRPAVALLAKDTPLALAPVLGKSLLVYWIEHLALRGIHEVLVHASDRPEQVRAAVGDGSRWGVTVQVIPKLNESLPGQAWGHAASAPSSETAPAGPESVVALDHFPGHPDRKLFGSYADWFLGVRTWLPSARTPDRIGLREIQPGVWAGLHVRIAPDVRFRAPCWLGDHVVVGARASLGPAAILENRVLVEPGARILRSVVGPDTFVGALTLLKNSLALGNILIKWQTGSSVRVPDAFLLAALREHGPRRRPVSLLKRSSAWLAPVIAPLMNWRELLSPRRRLLRDDLPPPTL